MSGFWAPDQQVFMINDPDQQVCIPGQDITILTFQSTGIYYLYLYPEDYLMPETPNGTRK